MPTLLAQRRWWALALLLWALASLLAWRLHTHEVRDNVVAVATEGARDMFRMVILTRSWNASHGGVYVPVSARTQPNPYLNHPRREITTTDGQRLTLINPAYMTRLISEIATLQTGAVFRLTSLRPLNPHNAPDAWERASLQAFEAEGVPEAQVIEPGPGAEPLLRYMAPLKVEAPCLVCHAVQGYQLGQVRGGISVSMRYAPLQATAQRTLAQNQWLYLGTFVGVAALGWLLLELLRRRWFDLVGQAAELAQTRDELVQSEKMASLGRMVAGFAHEVNTPVGVAVGAISHHADTLTEIDGLLQTDEVDEQRLRALLAQLREGDALAQSNLQRAARLVQSFKRTSIDQSADDTRDFDLGQLIGDVLFTLQHELKRLPIGVQVDCPAGLTLHGAPGVIEQVLTNLIMNAVLHAFAGGQRSGQIVIAAQRQGDAVLLRVRDDGLGMSPEVAARVFEPFYTTRRGQGGSGLGLYVCYNLVTQRLGGQITCTSAPGQGSTFELRFPAAPAPSAGPASAGAQQAS